MPRNEPKRARSNGQVQVQEYNEVDDHEYHTRVLLTGDMDPWYVFQSDLRTPLASPRHGNEALPQGSGE